MLPAINGSAQLKFSRVYFKKLRCAKHLCTTRIANCNFDKKPNTVPTEKKTEKIMKIIYGMIRQGRPGVYALFKHVIRRCC